MNGELKATGASHGGALDILQAPFVQETARMASLMYAHGWDERNGGNISLLLDEDEVLPYIDADQVIRRIPLNFQAPELAGRSVLVTGTGKYFKNVQADPAANLGLLRLTDQGDAVDLLWGFSDGGTFTSELPSHLMSHIARLAEDPKQRVVTHCHPTNLVAMTFVHTLDERAFTRTLWQVCSETVVVIPEGVSVLPWMVFGTTEIGQATAQKMHQTRLVVWAQHGVYGTGATLDEAFGLIETAEKAAEIYMKIAHLPRVNTIPDQLFAQLAQQYGVTLREGYLDL